MTYGEQAGRPRGRRGIPLVVATAVGPVPVLVVRERAAVPDAGDRAGPGGLVARTAEVLAMPVSGGVDASAGRLADLAADLGGPRRGQTEAEAVSRRVLAAMT